MVNGIAYLNEMIGNYLQYNIKTSICLSKSVREELEKESPEVIIWQNRNDNMLCLSSREEYYNILNADTIRYQGLKSLDYRIPQVLFTVRDSEKIEKILDALSEEDYLTKITNLTNVLDKQKTLKIK